MLTAKDEILIKFFQVLKLPLKLILNIRIVTSHQGIPKILCVCLKGFAVNLIYFILSPFLLFPVHET